MKIFMTLNKYNTRQLCDEFTHTQMVVILCLTELFQIELFFDIKTVFTIDWIVTYKCLNSLK